MVKIESTDGRIFILHNNFFKFSDMCNEFDLIEFSQGKLIDHGKFKIYDLKMKQFIENLKQGIITEAE